MKTKCPACKCSLEINIAPCGSCMNINHIKLEKALCKDGDHVPLKESLSHIYEEPKPVLHEADKARIEGISGKPLPPIEKLVYTVDGDDLERIQIVLNAAIDRLNINTC